MAAAGAAARCVRGGIRSRPLRHQPSLSTTPPALHPHQYQHHRLSIGTTPESLKRNHSQGTDAFRACLESNRQWASTTASKEPDFFPTSAKGQSPSILWLGCSDSRVPETTVLGVKPGDVFVHRNIANIVNPTDTSLLSVVEFSVRHLKVKHIVVCGHTSCGGVAATLGNGKLGILDVWLMPMRNLREKHAEALAQMEGPEKANALTKLNVQASVDVLKRIPTVVEAMKERGVEVHGLIYKLDSGVLDEVDCSEDAKLGEHRTSTFELQ